MVKVCSNLIKKLTKLNDSAILFSQLNDFIFCPVSLYFHNLYGDQVRESYQTKDQILGTIAHEKIDSAQYSSSSKILQGFSCYSEKYNLVGKIDLFDSEKGILTERKRTITTVYDGYVFQLYAQYFSLAEMGYKVKKIRLYSYTDNKPYPQLLPEENKEMLEKFERTIKAIRNFSFDDFHQDNCAKCKRCIYEPACDRSLL